MDYKKLAELLFPNITKTPEDYEKELLTLMDEIRNEKSA